MPVSGKENMVVRYIERTFGCNAEKAKEILTIIFTNLLVGQSQMLGVEPIVIKDSTKDAYQIDVSRYIVRNYKSTQYYRCKKCGSLTPCAEEYYKIKDAAGRKNGIDTFKIV